MMRMNSRGFGKCQEVGSRQVVCGTSIIGIAAALLGLVALLSLNSFILSVIIAAEVAIIVALGIAGKAAVIGAVIIVG